MLKGTKNGTEAGFSCLFEGTTQLFKHLNQAFVKLQSLKQEKRGCSVEQKRQTKTVNKYDSMENIRTKKGSFIAILSDKQHSFQWLFKQRNNVQ